MALPPPQFDTEDPQPLETNVVEVAAEGLAYCPVGGVYDETAGAYVTRAWEMHTPDAPPPESFDALEPVMPGPRPLDQVTTYVRVFVKDPQPGHRYRLEIGSSTHRFTFAERVRIEDPAKGRYEAPGEGRGGGEKKPGLLGWIWRKLTSG